MTNNGIRKIGTIYKVVQVKIEYQIHLEPKLIPKKKSNELLEPEKIWMRLFGTLCELVLNQNTRSIGNQTIHSLTKVEIFGASSRPGLTFWHLM